MNKLESKPESQQKKDPLAHAQLTSHLEPISVVKNYTHKVTVAVSNNQNKLNMTNDTINTLSIVKIGNSTHNITETTDVKEMGSTTDVSYLINETIKPYINQYASNLIKRVAIIEEYNNTDDMKKISRDATNEGNNWNGDTSIKEITKEITEQDIEPSKPKHEKGMIKVLSTLMKTFKKIMKQHADIKKIHMNLFSMKEDVDNTLNILTNKFQDFDVKYMNIMNLNDDIKKLHERIQAKDEFLKNKESLISKSLVEFEGQQKKFLSQQRQFYNIQKVMLAQNEKINSKQNSISKTQSDIAHRQNHFAKILKKAKEMCVTSDKPDRKPKPKDDILTMTPAVVPTTIMPSGTESIKINLFSIKPSFKPIVNHDKQMLQEKDKQPIDDLVYKYYFNNTFIDNLMKNNILSGFTINNHNTEIVRNVKNKRNDKKEDVKSTILLPVTKLREKRWIRHHKKMHTLRGKTEPILKKGKKANHKQDKVDKMMDEQIKINPFITMAVNFCNQIGSNANDQILNWCIEKALRRLKNIGKFYSYIKNVITSQQRHTHTSPGAFWTH